jgi:hypothetical protein
MKFLYQLGLACIGLILVMLIPNSTQGAGLNYLPIPTTNVDTWHGFWVPGTNLYKAYVTKGQYIWNYECAFNPDNITARECYARYVKTLAEHFSTLPNQSNFNGIPIPTDSLDTYSSYYLSDNRTLKIYVTKGNRIWHYQCDTTIPSANQPVFTCTAMYTKLLSEFLSPTGIGNQHNWQTPPPTDKFDTLHGFYVPDSQPALLKVYFSKGNRLWYYTCQQLSQGWVCNAVYTITLDQSFSAYQSVWNPPIPAPVTDLNAYWSYYLPDKRTVKAYAVKGDRIWHFTCNTSLANPANPAYTCNANYSAAINTHVAGITNQNIWSPTIPNRGTLNFTSINNRLTASLDGQWHISPLSPLSFSPITIPQFWKGDYWNYLYYTKTTYSNVLHKIYPYPEMKGPVWHAVKFTMPQQYQNNTVTLAFDAVATRAEVYLNGHALGTHLGTYNPFSFQVQNYLRFGSENLLNLKITESTPYEVGQSLPGNPRLPNTKYHRNLGGIWQSVSLNIANGASIENFQVTSPSLTSARFSVDVRSSTAQPVTLSVVVTDPVTNQVLTTSNYPSTYNAPANQSVRVVWNSLSNLPAKQWSPESPFLYRAVATLRSGSTILDTKTQTFGFRTFTTGYIPGPNSTQIPKLFLNGKPYFLKGVGSNIHIAQPNNREHATQVLTLIKNMGANAVRFWTFPTNTWLDEADRLGLLAVVNLGIDGLQLIGVGAIPPSPTPSHSPYPYPYTDTGFIQETKTAYEKIIRSIMSHPSVVMYELGNENMYAYRKLDAHHPHILSFFNQISTHVKSVDSTRLVLTDGGCQNELEPSQCGNSDVTDTHWYPLFYSCVGCSDQTLSQDLDGDLVKSTTKPHLVTEWGGAYTDDQGNLVGTTQPFYNFHGTQPDGYYTTSVKLRDSQQSLDAITDNPKRPDDALAYQAMVANRLGNIFKSKKDTTRLSGVFYWVFDNFVYNPSNLPWDKLRTWYMAAYDGSILPIPAPVINSTTWRNYNTLQVKPVYHSLQQVYQSFPGYTPLIGDVDKNYVVDSIDYVLMQSDFNKTNAPRSDLNYDGAVNIRDVNLLLKNLK